MIRNIPKYPGDRYLGEGDPCIRDPEGRIIAWSAGWSNEDFTDILKANHGSYESVGRYDTERGMIV